MTTTDLWYLAQHLAGLGGLWGHRVALVAPPDQFDGSFALFAQNRGVPVRACASFEEAIDWLAEGRTVAPPD